jgi:hypothetical protein
MKNVISSALCAALLFALIQCTQPTLTAPSDKEAAAAVSQADKVKLGEYLVTIGGCNDCHSPKVMTPQGPAPDPQRLLSGHPMAEQLPPVSDKIGPWVLFNMGSTAAVGPWGTSFAANLTPDDTGIGNWTEAQFVKCIREGKSKGLDGSRMLLPPMPWPGIAKMTDADLSAIFAYLQSIPPVKNAVPNPMPPTM